MVELGLGLDVTVISEASCERDVEDDTRAFLNAL